MISVCDGAGLSDGDVDVLVRARARTRRAAQAHSHGGDAVALGVGGLLLRGLLGLFGGEARLLGGPGVGIGLGLRILLRARGGEPHPLLLGLLAFSVAAAWASSAAILSS